MIWSIGFDSEVILTLGRSRALLQFLLEAKKKRSFEVFVAEGAPRYHFTIILITCKNIHGVFL